MSEQLVIAIDGPSGSGKSTTAKLLAQELELSYLDTGAMYRAATCTVLSRGISSPDDIIEAVAACRFEFNLSGNNFQISVDDENVTEEIREPRISAAVSKVATIPEVRVILTDLMRQIIADSSRRIVLEGRDITTVVAPDAEVRVLLVADPAARVARREAELRGDVTRADVEDQVLRRDRDDSTVSNFVEAAEGVTVIDSTFIGPDEVVARVKELIP